LSNFVCLLDCNTGDQKGNKTLLDIVVHACNNSTQEAEAGLLILGSLSYISRPYLRKKKKKAKNNKMNKSLFIYITPLPKILKISHLEFY
jgi:hypothetical protein